MKISKFEKSIGIVKRAKVDGIEITHIKDGFAERFLIDWDSESFSLSDFTHDGMGKGKSPKKFGQLILEKKGSWRQKKK